MLYLILTLLLISVGILAFLPRLQSLIGRYNTGVNFFLTLVATLVGVLLAIMISNYENEQQDKENYIKLIYAAVATLQETKEYSERLFEVKENHPELTAEQEQFFDKNPLPYPDYLDTFIAQSIVGRNISLPTLSDLSEQLTNLKRAKTTQEKLYLHFLQQTISTLQTEAKYQKGLINQDQLESELEKIKEVLARNLSALESQTD